MSYQKGYRDGCRDAARLLRDSRHYADLNMSGETIVSKALRELVLNILSDTASAIEALDAPEGSEAKELERGKEGR